MQQSATHLPQRRPAKEGWRIHAPFLPNEPDIAAVLADADWAALCEETARLGFDTLWMPLEWLDTGREGEARAADGAGPESAAAFTVALSRCVPACIGAGLRLQIDAGLSIDGESTAAQAVHERLLRVVCGLPAELAVAVSLRGLGRLPPANWNEIVAALRLARDGLQVVVWTPGMTPGQLLALSGLGIDAVCSSLPWWDFRAAWLIEEYERLRAIALVVAPLADPRAAAPAAEDAQRRLAAARLVGEGVLVAGALRPVFAAEPFANGVDAMFSHERRLADSAGQGPQRLSGALAPLTMLFRSEGMGRLLLLNPDARQHGALPREWVEHRLPDGYVLAGGQPAVFELAPGAWVYVPVRHAQYIVEHSLSSSQLRRNLSSALRAPRIAIEAVSPAVDDGAFPVKRSLGETVAVRANIFMDGHEELAAELRWRAANEDVWQYLPMTPLGNDAWEARITPRRLGHYVFAVRAWHDRWGSFCMALRKKAEAGVDVSVDVEEGRLVLDACLWDAEAADDGPAGVVRSALAALSGPAAAETGTRRRRPRPPLAARAQAGGEAAQAIRIPPATPEQVQVLLEARLAQAVAQLDTPAFETQTGTLYPLSVERSEATFSSWYEIFPRSQSPQAGRHGTLRDVIARLPQIRGMGFDVLYFPPIHPIGRQNRKGRNNTLQAGPDDPGSPYAIGAPEGGHDTVHPELGTLEDFRALVAATRQHGMEIALDFAIQCSPDHPWLREHPDWFNWRVDGTLKHAENPPKRYEDIVNPDFYSPLASAPQQAALWRALRDVVLFWVQQGVRIFRVDNPHTKPLPFWQWMLREVRDRHPDTIFLSEAFTRPAMMYRLAKLGFSQSYTYFTWRNTRHELSAYMTELNSQPVREFFRPNFFVNTPDINPWFLQESGRPGFLIRAVLACTLSGNWGMYNGFELCEARAVPGKEEYLDSEKYQLRRWDMAAPGNIIEEITRLNRIRRSHPALQSYLGIRFHDSGNEQVLFYSRHSAAGDSIVLVAVSLDPHGRQEARLALPRWEWGLADDAPLALHDLFEDHRFVLRGGFHDMALTPGRPFVLWAVARDEGAAA